MTTAFPKPAARPWSKPQKRVARVKQAARSGREARQHVWRDVLLPIVKFPIVVIVGVLFFLCHVAVYATALLAIASLPAFLFLFAALCFGLVIKTFGVFLSAIGGA